MLTLRLIPSPVRPRRGSTLVELLVAVTISALLVAIAAVVSQRLLTVQRQASAVDARTGALADAIVTLRRHLANTDPAAGDLLVASDTVLEFHHVVGLASVCEARGDTLVISQAHDSLPWGGTLPRTVSTSDRLRIWNDSTAQWATRNIVTVAASTGGCGDSTHPSTDKASQRLSLSAAIDAVHPAASVQILQRERWSLVLGGDGAWALSMRTWDADKNQYTTPQPLASPLAAPTAVGGSGLAVRATDVAGTTVPAAALATARSVNVVLRGRAHARDGTAIDSARINVGHH